MPAYADIPPPDTCDEAGEACTNAGPGFDQSGTCFQRTCSKGPPGQTVSYDCLRCEVAVGGGSEPHDEDDDSDDGCSVRGVGTERGLAGLMVLVGLALLGRGRRR